MKTMIMAVLALSAGAGLAFTLPAAAQEGKGPCAGDAAKFCQDVKPGGGRIIACLKEHETELSAECRAKGLEVKEKVRARTEACKGDLDKLCKGVKGGHGNKLGCLKDHEKELSEGCKAWMEAEKLEFTKNHPCTAETDKFCGSVKKGEGRIADCLKEHEKDLSETCRADFAKRKAERQKENPCLADMKKLCRDIKPGEGRLVNCLKAHQAELSEACKAKQAEKKGGAGGKPEAPAKPQGE